MRLGIFRLKSCIFDGQFSGKKKILRQTKICEWGGISLFRHDVSTTSTPFPLLGHCSKSFWTSFVFLSPLFFPLFAFFLSSLPIFPRKKLKLEFSCDVTSVCVVNNTLESPRKVSPCIYDELFGPSFMRRRRSFTRSVFTLRSTHCLWLYMAHNCTDRTVCRPVYRATVSS